MRELVNPSEAYLNSYIAACRETWGHTFSDYILHDPARVDAWRGSIFEDYAKAERGENLRPGFVPSRTFWFVEGPTTYLGTVNIRLQMNPSIHDGAGTAGFILRLSVRGRGLGSEIAQAAIEKARTLVTGPIVLNTENAVKILDRLHAHGVCPYRTRARRLCCIDGRPRELVQFTY